MPHKRLAVFVIALLILTLACGGVGAVNNPTSLPTQPSGKDNAGPTPEPTVSTVNYQPSVEVIKSWECLQESYNGDTYSKGVWIVQGYARSHVGSGTLTYRSLGVDNIVLDEEEVDFILDNEVTMLVTDDISTSVYGNGSRIIGTDTEITQFYSEPHQHPEIRNQFTANILGYMNYGDILGFYMELINNSDFAVEIDANGLVIDSQDRLWATYISFESEIPYNSSGQIGLGPIPGCGEDPPKIFYYWITVAVPIANDLFVLTNWPTGADVSQLPPYNQ